MNFQPALAELVMGGQKTVTRRVMSDNPRSPWWKGGCKLKVGRSYAVCPGRGKDQIGRVEVISVTQQTLGEAFGEFGDIAFGQTRGARVEAIREGFPSAVSFQLAWLKINKTYDASTRVWRIEFEVHRA